MLAAIAAPVNTPPMAAFIRTGCRRRFNHRLQLELSVMEYGDPLVRCFGAYYVILIILRGRWIVIENDQHQVPGAYHLAPSGGRREGDDEAEGSSFARLLQGVTEGDALRFRGPSLLPVAHPLEVATSRTWIWSSGLGTGSFDDFETSRIACISRASSGAVDGKSGFSRSLQIQSVLL